MPAAAAAAAAASASAASRAAPLSTPRASRRAAPRAAARCAVSNTTNARFALLFDCDGVIVETGTIVPPPPSLLDERTRIEP